MNDLNPTLKVVFDGDRRRSSDRRISQASFVDQNRRKSERRQTAFQAYLWQSKQTA